MSRRSEQAAALAASQASDAARVLQARQQESRQEPKEAKPEPESKPELKTESTELPQREEKDEPRKFNRGSPVKRESVMDQIRASRGEQEPEQEPEKEPERGAPPESQAPATPEPGEVTSTQELAAPVETVRVKVDGQESDVPKADVEAAGGVTAYQREKASENRLAQANQALAEAKRIRDQMADWVQKQQKPPEPVITDDEFIQSKMDVIRFGTPEEGARALVEIQNRGRPDPMAIVSQATAEMQHKMAEAQFRRDFADLYANPLLADLVAVQVQKQLAPLYQNGRADWAKLSQVDFPKFYANIGNQVRSVIGRPHQPAGTATAAPTSAATAPSPTSSVSAKEARKADIVNLPTAAARAALPEDPKPETREQALERMRLSRVPNM